MGHPIIENICHVFINIFFELSLHHYNSTSILPKGQRFPTPWKGIPLLFIFIFSIFITLLGAGFSWAYFSGLYAVDFTQTEFLKYYQPRDNTVFLDKKGDIIYEHYSEFHRYVKPPDMPEMMIKAVISAEDRSFYSHHGLDFKAIIRATYANVFTGSQLQGASTITQQLVRNFLLTKDKTFIRKAREALFSIYLEKEVSKSRILDLYLNSMYLGNRSYGVGSAAYNYFGKPIYALKIHEMALIAGLFQAPHRYNPFINEKLGKKRQLYVLRAMYEEGYISKEQFAEYSRKKLEYFRGIKHPKKAPYFVDFALSEAEKLLPQLNTLKDKGLRIFTTLDLNIQEKAENVLKKNDHMINTFALSMPREKGKEVPGHAIEAGIVLNNVANGAILAMIGGRDYQRSQFNRATQARRPPGSAFKPIVYGYALSRGHKWNEAFLVSPINISGYKPKNHSSNYLTESTLLQAFYKSINTPAVELANRLGIANVIGFAQSLGIKSPLRSELGTALGGSEVSMLDLLNAYHTIAAKGKKTDAYAIEKIVDGEGKVLYEHVPNTEVIESALDGTTSFLLTEGLRDVFRYGTAASYQYMHKYAAGKTGTTNDSRDTWFCGFTRNLVAITWVGIDGSAAISKRASGANLALPIWADLINAVDAKHSFDDTAPPEDVLAMNINPKYGTASSQGIPMWFRKNASPENDPLSAYKGIESPNATRSIFNR